MNIFTNHHPADDVDLGQEDPIIKQDQTEGNLVDSDVND